MAVKVIVVILFLLSSGVSAVDLTLQDNAAGSEVVRASIARLDYIFGILRSGESDFWTVNHSPFMRTLAYVESLDTNIITHALPSATSTIRVGLWKVDWTSFSSVYKRTLQATSLVDEINAALSEISLNFWTSMVLVNVQSKPLYSLIAARLTLLYSSIGTNERDLCNIGNTPTISSTVEQMANYWFSCYRRNDGDRTQLLSYFINRTRLLHLQDGDSECASYYNKVCVHDK